MTPNHRTIEHLTTAARRDFWIAFENGGTYLGKTGRGLTYGPVEQLVLGGFAETVSIVGARVGIRLTEKGQQIGRIIHDSINPPHYLRLR